MFIKCQQGGEIGNYFFDVIKMRFCKISQAGVKKGVWISYDGAMGAAKVGDRFEYRYKSKGGAEITLGGEILSIEHF